MQILQTNSNALLTDGSQESVVQEQREIDRKYKPSSGALHVPNDVMQPFGQRFCGGNQKPQIKVVNSKGSS